MNIQVAYLDSLMNHQQRLAFAQSAVYVASIFKCQLVDAPALD